MVVMAALQHLLKIVHKRNRAQTKSCTNDLCRDIAAHQEEDKLMGVPDPAGPADTFLRDVDVQRRLRGGAALDFYLSQPKAGVMIWAIDQTWCLV
jgi:hypothetical protein